MTEKNAEKSETVSPAREWEDTEVDLSENMVTFRNGTAFLPMLVDGKWKDVSFAEVLTAYAAHVSSLSSQAKKWICFHCEFETTDRAEAEAHFGDRDDAEEFKPICKWWARMDDSERLETLQDAIRQLNEAQDSLSSQTIASAAKEAAEKTMAAVMSEMDWRLGESRTTEEELEAIIVAAYEKARSK